MTEEDFDELIENADKVHIERLNDKWISVVIFLHGGMIRHFQIGSNDNVSIEERT